MTDLIDTAFSEQASAVSVSADPSTVQPAGARFTHSDASCDG